MSRGRNLTLPAFLAPCLSFPAQKALSALPPAPRLTWSPRRRRRLGSSIAVCSPDRPRPRSRPSPSTPPPNTIGPVGQLTPDRPRPFGRERFATLPVEGPRGSEPAEVTQQDRRTAHLDTKQKKFPDCIFKKKWVFRIFY